MKPRPLLFALTCLLLATDLRAADEWQLTWSDEFDYEGLPDPNKWGYEEGFVRNHEAQYYTRARRENARVENGRLILEARKEQWTPSGASVPVDYTSASIESLNKESVLFDRIEMRAKLPHGAGVWPAFSTMGIDAETVGSPKCGKIDVMEFAGQETEWIYGALHWAGADGKLQSSSGKARVAHPDNAFHVYAVNWDVSRIEFFVDDRRYHVMEVEKAGAGADNAFRKPHYLKLNLALGGSRGGTIDDSTLPQQMQVDYVRVYKQKLGP